MKEGVLDRGARGALFIIVLGRMTMGRGSLLRGAYAGLIAPPGVKST